MAFAIGQRWISDTESDLGLGTVVAIDARTVTLMFAASEEESYMLLAMRLLLALPSQPEIRLNLTKTGRFR